MKLSILKAKNKMMCKKINLKNKVAARKSFSDEA